MSNNDAAIRQHLDTAQVEIDSALALLDDEDGGGGEPEPGGDVIPCAPGDDLKAIIAAAPDGSTIAIDPAFVVQLGEWTINKPITLTSSAVPGAGRVGLALPGPIVRGFLNVTGADVTLRALRLEGHKPEGTLVQTGPHTTIDRCVVLGSAGGQHRGVCANSADVTIECCHIGNIWRDVDTQAVWGSNGTRNLRVSDCFLEASGENVMFGGADCSSEANQPADILIEDCDLYKPLAWRTTPGAVCKNLFELKNARRVIMRRCTLENCWLSGQEGYAIVLSVRNQNGTNPYATVADVLIEDCLTRNTGAGFSILGRDDIHPSAVMNNVTIRRVTLEAIDPKVMGGSGRQAMINGGPENLRFENCTWSGANLNTALYFVKPACPVVGFAYVGCSAHEGAYGIHGDGCSGGGAVVLDAYCPSGYVWENVTIIDDNPGRKITYPPGTTVVPAEGRTGEAEALPPWATAPVFHHHRKRGRGAVAPRG